MKKPIFPYPDHPPQWLGQWPGRTEVDRLFSLGIRAYANRVGSRQAIRAMTWTDDVLELTIASQRATWKLTDGEWRRSCTCGYQDAACVHCFLAARLFFAVADSEKWLGKDRTEASSDASRSGSGFWQSHGDGPSARSRFQDRDYDYSSRQSSRDLWYAGRNRPRPHHTLEPARLEVEVDFHYQPGRVTVRFYCEQRERRRLLRLQELYNFGFHARYSSNACEMWSEDDRKFLAWLAERLKATPEFKQGLNLIKLFDSKFEGWLETWRETPGRFIERSSQKPLQTERQPCRLHFELAPDGEMVRVAAIVSTPSGIRHQFHELFKLLTEGERNLVVDGQLLDFKPPVSWKILADFFSRKAPGIPREHVLEYLPAIIEHRFDLLHGELLDKQVETGAVPRLEVAADGGDLLLTPRIGEAAIHPEGVPTDQLRLNRKGELAVTIYQSDDLRALQQALRKLSLTRLESGVYRLPGRIEEVSKFLACWRELPSGVERRYPPELAPLLDSEISPRPRLELRRGSIYVDLKLSWRVGPLSIGDRELHAALRREPPLLRAISGHWLAVSAEGLEDKRHPFTTAGFGAGDRLRLFLPDARGLFLELERRNAEYAMADGQKALRQEIIDLPEPEELALPESLQSVLRDYQKAGFAFMANRVGYRIGAILADDMGLGKTVQMLALLLAMRDREQSARAHSPPERFRALVVCPASVTSVWLGEIAKFCPELQVAAYAGPPEQRRQMLDADWTVLVANYSLVRNDIEELEKRHFEVVILDEAQRIKNPDAQVSQAAKRLRSSRRLALTGTPLENRLLDLWSIMDFLNPGFLATRQTFCETYEAPNQAAELGRYIAPIMLRRSKSMVAAELPPRIDEVIKVEMGETQREFYDGLLADTREKAERGKSAIEMLALLTRLRQACCDPRLVRDSSLRTDQSAKLDTLMEMLEELLSENHSVLVFSQFVSMLELIEDRLQALDAPYAKITGSTPVERRGEIVRNFNQATRPEVFLLSLKAAGTGLTLTRADYVFIYDPWWNPAVENQAIDRTHRIGQTKNVVAYRLVAADSIEEKVMQMQRAKAELFQSVVADSTADTVAGKLTAADLRQLLA